MSEKGSFMVRYVRSGDHCEGGAYDKLSSEHGERRKRKEVVEGNGARWLGVRGERERAESTWSTRGRVGCLLVLAYAGLHWLALACARLSRLYLRACVAARCVSLRSTTHQCN